MARYTGPKTRKRQEFELPSARESSRRKATRPPRRSEYGERLYQKQKLKFIYGILERQMKRYVGDSLRSGENPQIDIMQKLETRLDNVVYRAGLGKTRTQARQMVNHGHVLVNSRKMDIPSHFVKIGDLISLKEKTAGKSWEQIEENRKERKIPSWIKVEGSNAKILSLPAEDELRKDVEAAKVIDFYRKGA